MALLTSPRLSCLQQITATAVVRGISSIASATDAKFEHEYLVKFKTMSYVHVQWLTAQEIGAACEEIDVTFRLLLIKCVMLCGMA